MFPAATYQARRQTLAAAIPSGLALILGNGESPMNYAGNDYPFRQDSNFRYFAGHARPDLALTVDAAGRSQLWGDDVSLDHIVWMGEQPAVRELAAAVGADYGGTRAQLAELLTRHADEVRYLPPYRAARRDYLRATVGHHDRPDGDLVRAVIAQRSVKSAAEIAEMEKAVRTSLQMHAAARRHAAPGQLEAAAAGVVEGIAVAAGGRLAYPAIVTRNGHVLHNHYHGNVLEAGDLLLIDAGAETPSGYAGDLTRTFAVGRPLTDRQRAVYNIVDRARTEAIAAARPGVANFDLHLGAGRTIAAGLKDLGLIKGDPAEAVAAGAHALFMPHGLGHMIGLDVHDMEDLGEDLVGYDAEFTRSEQFGTRNLRLGKRLAEGYVITVEPGIYFIPVLIDRWRAEGKHADFIDYEALAAYRDFGGIRLEDDVVITAEGSRTLGEKV